MNKNILTLNKVIQPYKDMVVNHDLYNKLNSADDISVLMSYHVYACLLYTSDAADE